MELLKMNKKNKFFIEKTKASLKHLGLVALIISLSVMFSSLCIMSLISLSDSLSEAMIGNPKSQLGAEVKVYTDPETSTNKIEEKVKELETEGIVKEYATLSAIYQQYVLYSSETYGREYISILGYEDESYPMDGVMSFQSGKDSMEELINNEEGIIISELLAKRNDINLGDEITLVSSDFFKNESFTVVDLIEEDYQGGIYSVFINADRLRSFEEVSANIFYIDGNQEKITQELVKVEDGLNMQTLDQFYEYSLESDRSYILFIRGLSILGLFIGSFGIASAIKVIINKRRRELGILKTIGFVGKDISKMLLMEVSVISIIGSFVGVLLGYIFFYYLVNILSSADSINIVLNTEFNILASVISFVVSIVSSVLFAYISIKQISEVKPVYALKDIGYTQTKKEKGKNILRFLIIALIFVGISIFLAQSVVYGIGAVAVVSLGILIFSLIFRLVYSLILKIPVKTHNAIELAWNNLRLNYKKIIVSMVAIFTGIVAINLINTLIYSTQRAYTDRYTEVRADINIVTNRGNPSDTELEKVLDREN
jgi:ABC-type lipoprotein release transport system permease subunit